MEILYLIGLVAFWLFKAYNQSKKKQKETERRRAEEARQDGGFETIDEQEQQPRPQTLPSLEDILREITGTEEEKPAPRPVVEAQEVIVEEEFRQQKPKLEEVVREVKRPVIEKEYVAPVNYTTKARKNIIKSDSSKLNRLKQDDLLNQRILNRGKKKRKSSSIQHFLRKEFNLKHAIVAQAILDPPYIKN